MDTRPTELSAADLLEIETEFRRAAEAIAAGNAGRARVCSRRACGVALRAWYLSHAIAGAPVDAQSLLKLASTDPGLPPKAMEAAWRLSAAVAGSQATTDPIADARSVIAAIISPTGESSPPADHV